MFRFQYPIYLYLLLLVPVLAAFYVYARYRRRKALQAYGEEDLVRRLSPEVSAVKPTLKFILMLLAVALFAVLLARPQFGTKLEVVKRQGIEVIIALDVSNSMLAQDVQPNRLEKSKRIISQLVEKMESDKVGMIVFAGDAFTQLPITSDYISAKMFLESVSPSMITKQGTDIGTAIRLGVHSFTPQEDVGKTIIIITDGENHEGGVEEALEEAKKKNIQVNVLGVGSADGGPIPIPGSNEYRKDDQGNVVVSRLNEDMCRQIAKEGQGVYIKVDNTNTAQKALQKALDKLARAEVETKVYSDYNEQFQSMAWIILILLLLELLLGNKKNRLLGNIHLFGDKKQKA